MFWFNASPATHVSPVKKNFFVSYNHKDTAWAEWIAWQLEEAGYSTVIQAWDFGVGQNFVLAMQKAVAEAERTIAVLSPHYLASRFTAPEWAAAFARDPTGEASVLVLVRVSECDLEGLLPQIVYVDLVKVDENTAVAKLIDAVTPGRKKPATKPQFPGATTQAASSAPPFPGSSAPSLPRRRAPLPRSESYLFVNVPPMPIHFVGRDELLTEMVERLTSGTDSALSASGQGGVGKTTMAVAIAHDPEVHGYFSDGVLWAGLGLSPDVMSALAAWGEALGVDVTQYPGAKQRAQAIRNRIGLRRFLLVIDDAWNEEAAMLLKCGGPNCCHLLTTRDDGIAQVFAGESGKVKVPVLEEEPAFELLRQFAPRACNANPVASRQLSQAVGGLPLALELLGAYLAPPRRNQFPELTDAAFAELADASRRLELATKRLGDLGGEEVTLRAIVRLSVEALPPEMVDAFNALGAFAPKPETFDLEAARAVTGGDAHTVAVLVEKNLVEHDGQKLALHQTIREAAFHDLPTGARKRHAQHYLALASAARDNWRDIEQAYGQMKWAFESLANDEISFRYTEALTHYHWLRGLWADSLHWNKRGLQAAEKRGDNWKVAVLANNLGSVYNALGQRENALRYFERALPIRQQVGDHLGEAATLNNIGSLYRKLGQLEKALRHFERALSIVQEVGGRSSEAVVLNNIGSVYNGMGQRREALRYYERALPITREAGDRASEAVTLNNIGSVYDSLGQRQEALWCFDRALSIAREVGDRANEAATLSNIGGVHDGLGRWEKALDCYGCALDIRQEIGERPGEAIVLNNIGLVYDRMGRQEKALHFYGRALPIMQEVGDRAGVATTLNNIGAVHKSRNEWEKALDHYGRSLLIAQEVGDRAGVATKLNNIGAVHKSRNEWEKALDHYGRALVIMQEVGDRAGEGTTLNNIGLVYASLGQRENALQYYSRALQIRLEVGDPGGEAVTRFNIATIFRSEGSLERAVTELRRVVELEALIQHPSLAQDQEALAAVEEEWKAQQQSGSS